MAASHLGTPRAPVELDGGDLGMRDGVDRIAGDEVNRRDLR